jgi:hypothetical protein
MECLVGHVYQDMGGGIKSKASNDNVKPSGSARPQSVTLNSNSETTRQCDEDFKRREMPNSARYFLIPGPYDYIITERGSTRGVVKDGDHCYSTRRNTVVFYYANKYTQETAPLAHALRAS